MSVESITVDIPSSALVGRQLAEMHMFATACSWAPTVTEFAPVTVGNPISIEGRLAVPETDDRAWLRHPLYKQVMAHELKLVLVDETLGSDEIDRRFQRLSQASDLSQQAMPPARSRTRDDYIRRQALSDAQQTVSLRHTPNVLEAAYALYRQNGSYALDSILMNNPVVADRIIAARRIYVARTATLLRPEPYQALEAEARADADSIVVQGKPDTPIGHWWRQYIKDLHRFRTSVI